MVARGRTGVSAPATARDRAVGRQAQRIKLASEVQRPRRRHTHYVLDEPTTTGLHPADVDLLDRQPDRLIDAGNTVVVAEHDMRMVAGADWVIDPGPGAGSDGGRVVAEGPPKKVARAKHSRTAPYLAKAVGADLLRIAKEHFKRMQLVTYEQSHPCVAQLF